MEYDASAVKDEFHKIKMEKFSSQAEAVEDQRNLYLREAGEELRRKEDAHGRLVGQLSQRPRAESVVFSLTFEKAAVRAQNMIRSQHASTDYNDSNLVVSLRSHSDCLLQQLFSAHRRPEGSTQLRSVY